MTNFTWRNGPKGVVLELSQDNPTQTCLGQEQDLPQLLQYLGEVILGPVQLEGERREVGSCGWSTVTSTRGLLRSSCGGLSLAADSCRRTPPRSPTDLTSFKGKSLEMVGFEQSLPMSEHIDDNDALDKNMKKSSDEAEEDIEQLLLSLLNRNL